MKINFKAFLEGSAGPHGEYVNDAAEKTMVHEIIRLLFGGNKTPDAYDKVYSFIEWDGAKDFYDKYYSVFVEKSENGALRTKDGVVKPLSHESAALLGEFRNKLKPLYKEWQSQAK